MRDANNSKFHLVYQEADWKTLFGIDQIDTLEWNAREGNVRLARQVASFQSAPTQMTITDPENRRGAARDRYGHWYWINETEDGILFCANGENSPVPFWSSLADDNCDQPNPDKGQFQPVTPPDPEPLTLRGLTVTRGHSLVVGVVGQGILLFDLHRGGPPTLLLWRLADERPFLPWDMAPTPDGGLLVLDRENLRYWRLNRHFQLSTTLAGPEEEPPPTTFQPKQEDGPEEDVDDDNQELRRIKQIVPHVGYTLSGIDDLLPPSAPISIEHGPANRVLILNAPDDGASQLYVYEQGQLITVHDLTYPVLDEDTSTRDEPLRAHDFAFLTLRIEKASAPSMPLQAAEIAADGAELALLFVARRDGNQVIPYLLDGEDPTFLDVQPDYLPLRRWQEKGLVAAGQQIYYDFGGCWIPLGVFQECVYATAGVMQSPANFEREHLAGEPETIYTLINGIPEQPFDSNTIGCVWHRLLLDAEIPAGTQIRIHARAADDAELLALQPWIEQPKPYQRSGGAELPYYDPYVTRQDDLTLSEQAGTWEILCQGIHGRYVQIQLTLLGTGRSTPEIQALRLWYPRFSYQANYLPAIYGEDPTSASFTERLLANYEGFYTNLEDKIVQLSSLLDPRITPPDALEWLGKWMGVVLHPLWDEERRRFFIRFAHRLYVMRGTVPGVIIGLRLFLDDEVDERIFDLDCLNSSSVRIIEHFLTRMVDGNETTSETITAAAHRFTVLIPYRFQEGQTTLGAATRSEVTQSDVIRMVERILELEKPAHTWFEIKEYWNMFRVGEARLGLDSQIGYSSTFQPLLLGDSILPDTYLGYPYPYNIQDRFVIGR